MKIFATADLHGNKKIMEKLKTLASEVDLILVCGDVGGKSYHNVSFSQLSDFQMADADYLCRVLKTMDTQCRFILGNDDWFECENPFYLQAAEVIKRYMSGKPTVLTVG